MLDTAAIALLAAALILWAFLPDHRVTGAILIAAALLNAVRLSRWAGIASWPEPLLFILHIGYGWVAVGTALLGLSIFNIGVPAASAIHALTAGAIAVMILAVMPRVTLGHTGRELTANRATVAVFVLINAAAIARVCASWHTGIHDDNAACVGRMLDCGVWPVRAGLRPDAADAAAPTS